MADSNRAQKSEVHATTDDAASSPASNFERGAADADIKRNPEAAAPGTGPGAAHDARAAAPPGATIESDESDDGGPIRMRTTDTDLKNAT